MINKNRLGKRAPILVSYASALCLGTIYSTVSVADTFISEIHYDNAGTDINEAIEITSDVSTDLNNWSVVLYNGSNGTVYNTTALSGFVNPAEGCGENGGALVVSYPSNGIQNGSPDAIALVNGSEVVQFISYEGSVTANDGPAVGMSSTDIGVSESSSTLDSESLQLVDGSWQAPAANTFGICTTPAAGVEPEPEINLEISEIHYDNSGADEGEAIEVIGPAGADVSGWSLALYNGSNGTVYSTSQLAGTLVAAEGCEEGTLTQSIAGIQNGSPDGIALINPNAEVVEFISYEGTLEATDGPAVGLTSADIGVAEPSSTPIGDSLQKVNGEWTGPAANTFNACNNAEVAPETYFIHEVQGSGDTVAVSGIVTLEAIVVGDFQLASQLSGFFIQEEDSDVDSDSATSEGIFVYCGDCTTEVNVGDRVKVTGATSEFFGMSQVSAFDADVEVVTTNQPLPSPAVVALPIITTASTVEAATAEINQYYEALEGMLVTTPQPLSVAEYFQLGRYGQVVLSANGRPMQFTNVNTPDAAGFIQHQIDLAARRIILDDDNNSQNSALFNDTAVFHPQPGFSVTNKFRGGDTIDNLTGVLHWSWAGFSGTNAWRIRPVIEAFDYEFTQMNQGTELPPQLSGALKVASFNVLNYFTTLDEGPAACGADGSLGCRGANSSNELERQTQKIVAAICGLDADVVGLMELENPQLNLVGDAPIDALVAAINQNCGPYAAVQTGTMGTDAITVGVIYKPETVAMTGNTAILDGVDFTDPNNTGLAKNRPAVAQTFVDTASNTEFTVVVNHLKSKGSGCGAGDDDTTTGQGNCNGTRTAAAQVQAEWLATNPTGVETDYVLVIGDLNAYAKEDPVTAFLDAGYTDLVAQFGGEGAYGYVFDGQLGYLDHALSSAALTPFVTGAAEWHINADEVNLLDYNDSVQDAGEASFEAKPSATELFANDPFRSSDHDPVLIAIDFPAGGPSCLGKPATIYVENGMIVGGPSDGAAFNGILFGTAEDDVIVTTDGMDLVVGSDGDDTICSLGGNDFVFSGRGADIVDAGEGNDIVFGNQDNDVIEGGAGRNILFGGQGSDTCSSGFSLGCEQ